MEYRKNSGQLSLSMGKVNYELFGENKQFTPIIVCHMPAVSFHYLYLFKELSKEHPVLFFSPRESDSLTEYAEQLREVVLELHLPMPHLLCHSYAAAYGLMHALENPAASVTFLSPVLSTTLWQRDREVYGKKECNAALQKCLPKELKTKKAKFMDIPFEFHFMSHLERLKLPTYISVGQLDLVSPATACDIHNKIEHSYLEIFSGVSHMHFLEAKEEFKVSYFHWLKSLERESRAIPQIINL